MTIKYELPFFEFKQSTYLMLPLQVFCCQLSGCKTPDDMGSRPALGRLKRTVPAIRGLSGAAQYMAPLIQTFSCVVTVMIAFLRS